jgi:phosphoribosyl-ATP pyrophosphohydrolase
MDVGPMANDVDHLFETILALRDAPPQRSRTARLFRDGMTKMAKKLAEEAAEVALEAVQGKRQAVISESADLLYNLCVLWAALGVRPDEVWRELARREQMMGIAEKLPKAGNLLRRRRAA